MFWPGISAQMKNFMGQCGICLTHRDSQVQELLRTPVSTQVELLLVVLDYFSNSIEVDSLSSEISKSVIKSLMARVGVPDTLVTDGPCFVSSEFAKFVD